MTRKEDGQVPDLELNTLLREGRLSDPRVRQELGPRIHDTGKEKLVLLPSFLTAEIGALKDEKQTILDVGGKSLKDLIDEGILDSDYVTRLAPLSERPPRMQVAFDPGRPTLPNPGRAWVDNVVREYDSKIRPNFSVAAYTPHIAVLAELVATNDVIGALVDSENGLWAQTPKGAIGSFGVYRRGDHIDVNSWTAMSLGGPRNLQVLGLLAPAMRLG